jgi:hypothetical protein
MYVYLVYNFCMDLHREYMRKTSFDLQDFNDYRLSAAGELQVYPGFHHPIHIEVGDDDLELTNIALPKDEGEAWYKEPSRLFILRNLSSASPEAHVVMDNTERMIGSIALNGVEYEVQGRKTYIIGRGEDATPQLDLSETVSRRHLQIRLGNMQGNLHFADLNTKNGTIVKMHEDDARSVYNASPRRRFIPTEEGLITFEQQQQRWSR